LTLIGGFGYVGLRLGIVFANWGLHVVLLDRGQAEIATVNGGDMPFMEDNALEQLRRVIGKQSTATSDGFKKGIPVYASRDSDIAPWPSEPRLQLLRHKCRVP
jgi:UDP-glucose 6-dehydrogenase